MRAYRWMLAACLFLSPLGGTDAQDVSPQAGGSAAGSVKEPTLPPVIVRPEEKPAAKAPLADGLDSGPPPPAEPNPWDQPLSYPRLSEQFLGGNEAEQLDGALRSDRSLYEVAPLATIVDREAIREKLPSDMAQALQNEVGVLMQQTARGQASPFLRGLTGQQVLILVDGVRLNNSVFRAGPNQYFNLIDPGSVERIEVVRGPQSVLWGSDALGGVINIVTRSAARDRGHYAGGSFVQSFSTADTASYSRANVEGWVSHSGVFAGGSYLNVNDLDRGGGLGRQPFTDYDQYAGDVKFSYLLDDDTLLTVVCQHFEQSDLPRSDRFAPFVYGPPAGQPRPTWFDPQQRDLAYIRLQGLAINGLFDAYSATVSYSRNKEGSEEIRSATRTDLSEFDLNTLGGNLTLARDLDWLGRLTYGADYYDDDVDAVRDRLNPLTNQSTATNPQFPDDSRYQRAGAFLNWDVDPTERLNANAGVRYEMADTAGTLNAVQGTPTPFQRSYQGWISSAGLVYEVTPMLHLVGDVSEGFRAPNLDDLTADNPVLQNAQDLPSLDVQPERARTYEVGLKLDAPRLRLQVCEYWTDLQNNILRQAVDAQGNPVPNVVGPYGTLIPGSSNFIRDNFDSYLNGTELAAEYLLPDGWSVYGNFWYTYGQDLERDEPLSRIPPTQGYLGVRWRDACRRQWLDVYTWLVARQDRYSAQNNIDARFPVGGTPGYATLNLRMGTTLGCCDQHRLSLNLENITDTYYRVLGSGVDGPGFNAVFGYEWSR